MLSASHSHYVARFVNDYSTNSGIAHDTHEGICMAALTMLQNTGNSVRILSCDSNGNTLDALLIVTPHGIENV